VSVQVGQKGTGRLTSFLSTEADRVVGGPSQWRVAELSEAIQARAPEGSFLVRSEVLFKIHSSFFCRDESPACIMHLLVVPTEDGKGLDDPDKSWGVRSSPIVGYPQLLFPVTQRHNVLRVLTHLLR
jgi:hypothetical protein